MKTKQTKKINGIEVAEIDNSVFCHVNDFSEEIKAEIRLMLSGIFHGAAEVKQNNEIYNYKNTVKNFVNRYSNHSEKTKKGMIGELLTHLLVPRYLNKFKSISVFKNKEENSIRKGFDVVYFDSSDLWYCEIKSGESKKVNHINKCNASLLNKAKTQISSSTTSNRSALWESVLTDVHLTVFNSRKKKNIRELLQQDHPSSSNRNLNRNVILTSVVFCEKDEKICINELNNHWKKIQNENLFSGLIVFSIQKSTYKKIEDFLISESRT